MYCVCILFVLARSKEARQYIRFKAFFSIQFYLYLFVSNIYVPSHEKTCINDKICFSVLTYILYILYWTNSGNFSYLLSMLRYQHFKKHTVVKFKMTVIVVFRNIYGANNSRFRNYQIYSFITEHGHFKTNNFGLYCQVTLWPRKHKKTLLQAFTRSKKIYSIW